MKPKYLFFILLSGQMFMNCNRKQDANEAKFEIRSVEIGEEVDDSAELSARRTSKSKSIQKWLSDICDKDKPKIAIAYYHFGIFEAGDHFTVVLVGLNKYAQENSSVTRIDFKPSKMYFDLPKSKHGNSGREQVVDSVKAQLKTFIETEKFKTSFFAQADSIEINSEPNVREKIWSK